MRTAECVSPGHPDKLCDIISDSILDEYLKQDPNSRVAVETMGGHGKVFITGEVTSNATITDSDIRTIVCNVCGVKDVTINLTKQSPLIAQGVDIGGAGDQGIMIGYACNENDQRLPQEYYLSRELNKLVYDEFPYDGKTQVTITNDKNVRVVCSFQNASSKSLEELCKDFFTEKSYNIESLHCNPSGDWNVGGFDADAGVTGRKLAVDNYGPRVPIGGGAFSGKDATKVDRSAAYMARRIAVDYLDRCFGVDEIYVQLAYAIGYEQPLQATAMIGNHIANIEEYDLSPTGIIGFLDLKQPIYAQTAKFGHMGCGFNWK